MTDEQEQRGQSEELTDLQRRIALGMDVKVFLRSNVGKHLERRATEMLEGALKGLGTVDAEEPKAIRLLQQQFQTAHFFMDWLEEAIHDGEQAEAAYRAAENSD